jgi:hypothetical protein
VMSSVCQGATQEEPGRAGSDDGDLHVLVRFFISY